MKKKYYLEVIRPDGRTDVQILDPELDYTTVRGSIRLKPLLFSETSHSDSQRARFWVEATEGTIEVGDLQIASGSIRLEQPFRWGEERCCIRPDGLSTQSESDPPSAPVAWKTVSPLGVKLLKTIKKAAATTLPIFLEGQTGTGKDLLARLLHQWSPRADQPFVPVNCAALPLSIAESELFGHTKGAFTGADRSRKGALQQAHEGTLFLDEIGDLPLEIQAKLLRFLENGEVRPLGSDQLVQTQVRLVCASHKSLDRLVHEGKFRRDLYYRVASITIEVPSLQERPEDISYLAQEFASRLGKALDAEVLSFLNTHVWPGNARELKLTVERAAGMAGEQESILTTAHFAFPIASRSAWLTPLISVDDPTAPLLPMREMERRQFLKALELSQGKRPEAAKLLGMPRSTFYERCRRLQVGTSKGSRSQRAS